jgi:hypothetical protein
MFTKLVNVVLRKCQTAGQWCICNVFHPLVRRLEAVPGFYHGAKCSRTLYLGSQPYLWQTSADISFEDHEQLAQVMRGKKVSVHLCVSKLPLTETRGIRNNALSQLAFES